MTGGAPPPAGDLLVFRDENIHAQLATARYHLGAYELRFYADAVGRPSARVTDTVSTFYLYPSGGTLRDASFNIIFYDSRFDTTRGFRPPHHDRGA